MRINYKLEPLSLYNKVLKGGKIEKV